MSDPKNAAPALKVRRRRPKRGGGRQRARDGPVSEQAPAAGEDEETAAGARARLREKRRPGRRAPSEAVPPLREDEGEAAAAAAAAPAPGLVQSTGRYTAADIDRLRGNAPPPPPPPPPAAARAEQDEDAGEEDDAPMAAAAAPIRVYSREEIDAAKKKRERMRALARGDYIPLVTDDPLEREYGRAAETGRAASSALVRAEDDDLEEAAAQMPFGDPGRDKAGAGGDALPEVVEVSDDDGADGLRQQQHRPAAGGGGGGGDSDAGAALEGRLDAAERQLAEAEEGTRAALAETSREADEARQRLEALRLEIEGSDEGFQLYQRVQECVADLAAFLDAKAGLVDDALAEMHELDTEEASERERLAALHWADAAAAGGAPAAPDAAPPGVDRFGRDTASAGREAARLRAEQRAAAGGDADEAAAAEARGVYEPRREVVLADLDEALGEARDEVRDASAALDALAEWARARPASFGDALAGLAAADVARTRVRAELARWDALREPELYSMAWYRKLLSFPDELVVPRVVEAEAAPAVAHALRWRWDPPRHGGAAAARLLVTVAEHAVDLDSTAGTAAAWEAALARLADAVAAHEAVPGAARPLRRGLALVRAAGELHRCDPPAATREALRALAARAAATCEPRAAADDAAARAAAAAGGWPAPAGMGHDALARMLVVP